MPLCHSPSDNKSSQICSMLWFMVPSRDKLASERGRWSWLQLRSSFHVLYGLTPGIGKMLPSECSGCSTVVESSCGREFDSRLVLGFFVFPFLSNVSLKLKEIRCNYSMATIKLNREFFFSVRNEKEWKKAAFLREKITGVALIQCGHHSIENVMVISP